jgi:hypothetical protein
LIPDFLVLRIDPTIAPWLPFFFIFAIVFGLLSITPPKWPKAVDAIIALTLAFLASGTPTFVQFFFANFDLVVWAFVGIFFLVLFVEILQRVRKVGIARGHEEIPLVLGLVAIILLITIGVSSIPALGGIVFALGGPQNFLIIIGLILLVIIFYYAYILGKGMTVEEAVKVLEEEKKKKTAGG